MDMNTIGYFLYMEHEEKKKEQAEEEKVNLGKEFDLESEQTTTKKKGY